VPPRKRRRREPAVLDAPTIRARCIQITDYKGRTVAEIAAYRGGGAVVVTRPDGRPLIVMGLDTEQVLGGGGFIAAYGPSGEMAVNVSARRQGGQVTVFDAHGDGLGQMGAFDMADVGGAMLQLRGRESTFRVQNGRPEVRAHPISESPRAATSRRTPQTRQAARIGVARRLEAFTF
jgi:hypothetical protein